MRDPSIRLNNVVVHDMQNAVAVLSILNSSVRTFHFALSSSHFFPAYRFHAPGSRCPFPHQLPWPLLAWITSSAGELTCLLLELIGQRNQGSSRARKWSIFTRSKREPSEFSSSKLARYESFDHLCASIIQPFLLSRVSSCSALGTRHPSCASS